MMVEKRQSSSRAVQGYTTGCRPAPEPSTSLGKARSSWKEQREEVSKGKPGAERPPCGVLAGPPGQFSSSQAQSALGPSFGLWSIWVAKM